MGEQKTEIFWGSPSFFVFFQFFGLYIFFYVGKVVTKNSIPNRNLIICLRLKIAKKCPFEKPGRKMNTILFACFL